MTHPVANPAPGVGDRVQVTHADSALEGVVGIVKAIEGVVGIVKAIDASLAPGVSFLELEPIERWPFAGRTPRSVHVKSDRCIVLERGDGAAS